MGAFDVSGMSETSLSCTADLAALPTCLEGTVAIELDGYELDIFALVIRHATFTKVIVRQVGRVPTEADDGCGKASIAGMASMNKVCAWTIGLGRRGGGFGGTVK